MDFLASLIVTITGDVICHYIIKWLDRNKLVGNEPTDLLPTVFGNRKPQSCRSGVFVLVVKSHELLTSLCLLAL